VARLRNWLAVLVLGVATIAVAYLPPSPPEPSRFYSNDWWSRPTPEGRRAKRLGDEYQAIIERLRITGVKDSLLRLLNRRPSVADTAVVLLAPASLSPRLKASAEGVRRAATPKVAMRSPGIRAAVALPLDVAAGMFAPRVFTPSATDGRTCLSVVPVGDWSLSRGQVFPQGWLRAADALGPCAFYLAFGHPGPRIERWMMARHFDVAMLPDWYAQPRGPMPVEPRTVTWRFMALAQQMGGQNPMQFVGEVPYWMSFSAIHCSAGDPAFCRRYLLSDSYPLGSTPGVVYLRPSWSDPSNILSALVREMGPDRFSKFWRSPLAPDSAFHQAFGVSFDAWAPKWAYAQIGFSAREDTAPGVRETLATLVWSGLFVCGCVAFAMRRQVA
jgi:hypothetical protein